MTTLTHEQRTAVGSTGDVLLVAGAGTGKTRTLVERCLAAMLDPERPIPLGRMLVVTFTEAAATELRKRIRARLEERLRQQPDDSWLVEQLAWIECARISTLHGFCLHLVRDHFHQLGIDPAVTVASEEQTALLARETMDNLLRRQYQGEGGDAEALQQLVLAHGRGWDEPVRRIILRLHKYARSLRDPSAWFDRERARLDRAEPAHWEAWLLAGFADWRREWLDALSDYSGPTVAACRALLEKLPDQIDRGALADTLAAIREAESIRGRRRDPARDAMKPFFVEAAFLASVATTVDGADPLRQDWTWSRGPLRELLDLARRFGDEFNAAKRAQASLDFSDLEQFALKLLWDCSVGRPTTLAEQIRRQFDLVFVDEYQDINEAQDTLLRAVGREGASANRFLVGDVKQSIYRFRLADPRIFQGYMADWADGQEHQRVLHLTENFRSHERILDFVNGVFGALMQTDVGGVEYDRHQHLRFGAPQLRTALRSNTPGPPRVEVHLLPTDESSADPDLELAEDEPPSKAEREAEVIGRRMQQLRADGFQVWDAPEQSLRPVRWRDMAILLRAPAGKAEAYAKVFERLGIPLQLARGGFFEATEITDLLSLLQVLDNPLQDLPLLAALRAPWAALSPDELACVRLASPLSDFWTALRRFHRIYRSGIATGAGGAIPESPAASAWAKAARFLDDYRVWRRRLRQEPLSACLESVLDETGYEAWLSTQARAPQRLANVQRLLLLTRQFDEFQRQGLFRFLRFVESQQAAGFDAEPASPAGMDAVQFLSVHQSKGLEFPVVAVADLGKRFNTQDLYDAIILDEEFGVGAQIRPPHLVGRYPSLPYWLARRRQKREMLGEELRLFYVAMTRACDLLLLSGSLASTRLEKRWTGSTEARPSTRRILSALCSLDWLAAVLPGLAGSDHWTESGVAPGFVWQVHPCGEPTQPREKSEARPAAQCPPPSAQELTELERKLAWRYPFRMATVEPAKTSVSALRRRAADDRDEDAVVWRPRQSPRVLSGVEVGDAHHLLIESMALSDAHDVAALGAEARRLARLGILSDAQVDALDLEAIAGFWQSPVGTEMRAREPVVHRELPFTARFSLRELAALDLTREGTICDGGEDEWVIVQGYVDLAMIGSEEIWVLDFKTDRAADADSLVNAYGPQLRLYAQALSRIYSRPVTRLWLHSLTARQSIPLPLHSIN